jgi:HNH endonuclease
MTNYRVVEDLYPKMVADVSERQPTATVPLCPLCLQPFVCEKDSLLRPTADHVIPESVGGTLCILTCKHCNNTHGSALDSRLKKAMDALDFLSGNGSLPILIKDTIGHISANLDWNDASPVRINVVGEKASHPAAIENLRRRLSVDRKLDFTVRFGSVPEVFWRAILRVGYMAAFQQFGYAYALSRGGAQVREALSGGVLLNNIVLSAYPSDNLEVPFLVHSLKDGIFVLFKVQSKLTRWLAVMLPGLEGCAWEDIGKISPAASRLRIVVKRADHMEITVGFGPEPVEEIRGLRFPLTRL